MNKTTYNTASQFSAATLLAAGVPLIRVDRINGNRALFIFDNADSRAQTIMDGFWNNTLADVPQPRQLFGALTEVRSWIHKARDGR